MRAQPLCSSLLLALTCCQSEPASYQRYSEAKRLPDKAPFQYYGRILRFPPDTLEVRVEQGEPRGPYANLKPQGRKSDFDYYLELGLSTSITPSASDDAYSGFARLTAVGVRSELKNGYVLWCEPIEQTRGNCAVLLKSLPFALLQFVITKPPSDTEAEAAISASEKLLASMIVSK